ncbi:MAG TPA: AraC family transcriptional regulator [Paraburkholderia sp.]
MNSEPFRIWTVPRAFDVHDSGLEQVPAGESAPIVEEWSLGDLAIATLTAENVSVVALSDDIGNPTFVTFVKTGWISVQSGQERHRIEAPSMVMVDTEIAHSQCFLERSDAVLLRVPRYHLVARGFGSVRFGMVCADLLPVDNRVVSDFFSLLAQQAGKSSHEMRRLQSEHLLDVLLFAFGRLRNASSRYGSTEVLQHAKRYIVENLSNVNLNVRHIADASGVSVFQLQRVFNRDGCTVMRYVQQCRMRLAADLLTGVLARPDRISEIARICGFSNQAHFSKTFRRYFGIAPKDAKEHLVKTFVRPDTA